MLLNYVSGEKIFLPFFFSLSLHLVLFPLAHYHATALHYDEGKFHQHEGRFDLLPFAKDEPSGQKAFYLPDLVFTQESEAFFDSKKKKAGLHTKFLGGFFQSTWVSADSLIPSDPIHYVPPNSYYFFHSALSPPA